MLKLLLFPLLLLFLSGPLLAESSATNRQTLKYGVGLSGDVGRARSSFYYYAHPDLVLEAFHRRITDVFPDDNLGDWHRDEKSFGVAANAFISNAWFFRLGLISRQAAFTNNFYNRDNSTGSWHRSFDLVVHQQDLAAEAAIGTQWQWSNFYFGFDWLNYEYRVVKIKSSTSIAVVDSTRVRMNYAESRIEQGRVADNDLNRSNLYLSARIGWSF